MSSFKHTLTLLVIGFTLTAPVFHHRALVTFPSTPIYGPELESKTIRAAFGSNKHHLDAEKAVSEAEQLLKEWKAESTRAAIAKFKEALVSWRLAGEPDEEARTLRRIGDAYQAQGEYETALSHYESALLHCRRIGDLRCEGQVLGDIGYVYITLGETQKALSFCSRALERSRALGDRREEARALNNLGEVDYSFGELQQSLEHYRQALGLWRELGDQSGLALTLLNFGYTYSDQGQMTEALDSFNQALLGWQAVADQRGQALTLTAIGRLYSRTGESQKALEFFARSTELIRRLGDPIEEARILNGMADVYAGLGDGRKALALYIKALALFKRAKYQNGEATTLGLIGKAYNSLADTQRALEYHQQAWSIFRSVRDHRMEMAELKEIGKVYEAQGNKKKALENYLFARSVYHAQGDLRGEAVILNLIGGVYEGMGQEQAALDCYNRALRPSQQSEYRSAEATTLYHIARLERNQGNLMPARARTEAAIALVESLRTKVASQDLRSSYFASVRQHYELYIDILMQLHKQQPTGGFDALAFQVSETARARSLLELLREARADIREGVTPELLDQERSLKEALNANAERRVKLLAAGDKEQAEILAKEIDQLASRYEEIEARIRSSSPRYAALTQPHPLSLAEIQRQVLDDDSLLLEYALGDERSYLWAVTRSEVWSYELPGREIIEDAVRRVYRLLTANQPVPGETFAQRQNRVAEADAQLLPETMALSKHLLGPVTTRLGNKRLLVIPDGALQYLPFQILTVPRNSQVGETSVATRAEDLVPLVLEHEIVNEPSASTLALVLSDLANRKPAPYSIAVLADPVFEADDPRVKFSSAGKIEGASEHSESSAVRRALRDVRISPDGVQVPRLISSRAEAEAILNFAPWGTRLKALGFDASRATVTSDYLSRFRIVHFATHGVVDNEHPQLSGIVLSLVDEQGHPQDGFLRLHDIYNLKLQADLVVLSACNTGLGKDVKGEGLIGLTRGFMYAGAGGVVASLWKVDDEATAKLMSSFYEHMFEKGLSPSAALREAQLEMWKQKQWHAPYYWAAFVIQGQYSEKQGVVPGREFSRVAAAGVGVALVGLITAIFFLRRRRRRIL